MTLTSYINLYEVLQNDTATKKEKRDFGLQKEMKNASSFSKLIAWQERIMLVCQKPFLSDTILEYLYKITFVLVLISFVAGFFSGSMLLSYSGKEPVNIIYFLAMVVVLPLFTMLITLFSMLQANKKHDIWVDISSTLWLEKILSILPNQKNVKMDILTKNPLLLNWTIIKRSQLLALFFSLGLLLSLFFVIVTKDIAFSWSSTLNVNAKEFYDFIYTLSFPWRAYLPSAVPSVELIEQSHYFRLGHRLNAEMVQNASKLGEWWKFLLLCTLFYALFLRIVVYSIASFGFQKALKKSFFSLDGVKELLFDMREAIVSSNALTSEKRFISTSLEEMDKVEMLNKQYDVIQGWSLLTSQIKEINGFMKLESSLVFGVGGGNSLSKDTQIIKESFGEVLLYVKAWEPPTMDFMDYLDELLPCVDKIIIYPLGTQEEEYLSKERFIDIWERKISALNNEKVWIKR